MEHFGYSGKLLRVNLENGGISIDQPEPSYYKKYLGGRGIIMHTLLKEIPANTDPLGPGNKLVFALGLLTGHKIIGSGSCSVGAKSPLTGACGEAEAGGMSKKLVRSPSWTNTEWPWRAALTVRSAARKKSSSPMHPGRLTPSMAVLNMKPWPRSGPIC